MNIVVYRPPDTHSVEFADAMDKIKKLLGDMVSPEPSVIITGDFNFPFIEWKRGELNACKWKMKTYNNAKEDEKKANPTDKNNTDENHSSKSFIIMFTNLVPMILAYDF